MQVKFCFADCQEFEKNNAGAISTLTRTLICQQLEAFSAVALEAADGVPAEVIATAVVKLTLIDICGIQVISTLDNTLARLPIS